MRLVIRQQNIGEVDYCIENMSRISCRVLVEPMLMKHGAGGETYARFGHYIPVVSFMHIFHQKSSIKCRKRRF